MKKLSSLSIFFPFLNDQGTVIGQITLAYSIGSLYADDIEVIAIHGGRSSDKTLEYILQMKKQFPKLKIIRKENNAEGYAVIKHGIAASTKEWIFYTDGDAQYHLEEDLPRLIEKQIKTQADVVNGYKKVRHDNLFRVIFGKMYSNISGYVFRHPIRDIDCDFRLMRRSLLTQFTLDSKDASILPELILKLRMAKAKFIELPVNHYPRVYGKSNYSIIGLLKEKIIGDYKLYKRLHKKDFKFRKINLK